MSTAIEQLEGTYQATIELMKEGEMSGSDDVPLAIFNLRTRLTVEALKEIESRQKRICDQIRKSHGVDIYNPPSADKIFLHEKKVCNA